MIKLARGNWDCLDEAYQPRLPRLCLRHIPILWTYYLIGWPTPRSSDQESHNLLASKSRWRDSSTRSSLVRRLTGLPRALCLTRSWPSLTHSIVLKGPCYLCTCHDHLHQEGELRRVCCSLEFSSVQATSTSSLSPSLLARLACPFV